MNTDTHHTISFRDWSVPIPPMVVPDDDFQLSVYDRDQRIRVGAPVRITGYKKRLIVAEITYSFPKYYPPLTNVTIRHVP